MSNLGYRLGVDELFNLKGSEVSTLYDKVRILDLLYQSTQGLMRRDIQQIMAGGDGKDPSVARVFQNKLNELCKLNLIRKIEVNKRDFKFVLTSKDSNNSSVKYSNNELKQFKEWRSLLQTYNYIPFIKDVIDVIVRDAGSDSKKMQYNDFKAHKYEGTGYIEELYRAIKARNCVDVEYEKDGVSTLHEGFMPYLLKEHNKRWYIVGKEKYNPELIIYTLERIKKVRIDSLKKFERDNNFNVESIWRYSSGIYPSWKNTPKKDDKDVDSDYNPVQISFKVKDGGKFDNIRYLNTLKLNEDQEFKISEKDAEGYALVSFLRFPDTDIVREIRKIGLHCVEDIQPVELDEWVRFG